MGVERLTTQSQIKFEAVKKFHIRAKCGHCYDCFYLQICLHCGFDLKLQFKENNN